MALIVKDRIVECSLVVFDKNGTLVDQLPLLLELARARKKSVQRHAGKEAAQLWEKVVGVNLNDATVDHDGPLSTAPRREELLIAASALYLSGYSWNEAKQSAQKAYDEADDSLKPPYGSVLLEKVAETLRQLKRSGLKLAIASTDSHRRTVESFKALGLESLFEVIVGSDDVSNGKPSPDMIIEILKRTSSKPEETVMVGDSASDMLMARNSKIKLCIGVLTGFTPREKLEQLADEVVSSVAELRAV